MEQPENDRYVRQDALRIASDNKDIEGLTKKASKIVEFIKGDGNPFDMMDNKENIACSNVNPDDKVVPLT